MNEIIEALKKRRSIKKYKPDPVSRELLEEIADAGLYAANGKGKQAVKIVVVTNKKLRDQLSDINRQIGGWQEGFDPFYGAPVTMVVLADKTVPTSVCDGSLVLGNLMQAADALGLGSCWINRAKETFEREDGKQILKDIGIEGEWEGVGHCVVGYQDGETPKAAPRKPDRVLWVE